MLENNNYELFKLFKQLFELFKLSFNGSKETFHKMELNGKKSIYMNENAQFHNDKKKCKNNLKH